ncbi:hypothetical protein [Methylovulum psychrotolerans]|uniref:Uncharacterized protein n=1 Tax=Methylovulum psychrotolerans TaxID=1704499 RepID=A0A2S5CST4_9GAMM|nr:hypothetical protein [Methylovulum psychrotolerans]POZ53865.1 hypothetical protein AADEFJLK_00906 [Methylovulum psychrotolerans]
MTFQDIVSSHLDQFKSDIECRCCPYQVVGTVIRSKIRCFTRKDVSQRSNDPALILILESPHIDEFKVNPPEPAKGWTVTNIKDYLYRFKSYLPTNDRELILVNAIQYQCSLGVDTEVFRYDIFTDVWNDFGETNFIERFSSLLKEGDFVINACTQGNESGPFLRDLVETAIINVIGSGSDLHTFHPSCWHNEKHKSKKWLWTPKN